VQGDTKSGVCEVKFIGFFLQESKIQSTVSGGRKASALLLAHTFATVVYAHLAGK
jgi:hypothetical protein